MGINFDIVFFNYNVIIGGVECIFKFFIIIQIVCIVGSGFVGLYLIEIVFVFKGCIFNANGFVFFIYSF